MVNALWGRNPWQPKASTKMKFNSALVIFTSLACSSILPAGTAYCMHVEAEVLGTLCIIFIFFQPFPNTQKTPVFPAQIVQPTKHLSGLTSSPGTWSRRSLPSMDLSAPGSNALPSSFSTGFMPGGSPTCNRQKQKNNATSYKTAAMPKTPLSWHHLGKHNS